MKSRAFRRVTAGLCLMAAVCCAGCSAEPGASQAAPAGTPDTVKPTTAATTTTTARTAHIPEGMSATLPLTEPTQGTDREEAPTTTRTYAIHPRLTLTADKAVYGPADRVSLTLTDTENQGFRFGDQTTLWIQKDGEWESLVRPGGQAVRDLMVWPQPEGRKATINLSVPLDAYPDLETPGEYRVTLIVEDQMVAVEFTVQ